VVDVRVGARVDAQVDVQAAASPGIATSVPARAGRVTATAAAMGAGGGRLKARRRDVPDIDRGREYSRPLVQN